MKIFRTFFLFLLFLGIFSPLSLRGASKWEIFSRTIEKQVGVRYRFGGDSPSVGFDCSGLVRYAYSKIGKVLPHSTRILKKMGKKIPLSQLRRGDLIFFSLGGQISHVGVYLGYGVVIHAPSTGKNVTVMDVFHHIYWKNKVAFARRIVENL